MSVLYIIVVISEINSSDANGRHALNKEYSGETASSDLVDDVLLGLP
jgi:hypothetical protein